MGEHNRSRTAQERMKRAPHVHHGGTVLNWHDYVQCAVEPEFVLGIGKDVAAEVEDETELLDAIDWVAPGIEIHNYRFWFGEPTSQELIASNGIHAGLVVGKQRVSPAQVDFQLEGVGLFRSGQLEASGIGAEIMGGPLKSLAWLTNHLVRHGEHIRAGQLVIYTVLDACSFVLENEDQPQSPYWLASIMDEMKLWKASEHDVRAALEKDIAELGEESRFAKVADDEYALRSWTTGP